MPTLPYIPEKITVHLGAPDESAANVTVSFPDYIKNVASSEIYPTWPQNALYANIYAQISFALNRIYTEYYRSRGYDFDITNNTAYDQSFVNGRNYFDSIIRVVDEIFNSYIRRRNFIEPLFAQYCNGTTVTCEGMSQWGSVELAEQGYFAYEILNYYYGTDIEIVRNAPIQGIVSSLPPRNLRLGATGNSVALVQTRLNRISNNYPSIPKINDASGYFDIATEEAVREFQRIFNLTVDGVVGRATWYRIIYIYAAVKRLNDLNSEGIKYDEISGQFPNVLEEGDSGDYILLIQYMLNYIAQYENTISQIEIDGYYGTETKSAVEGFQRSYSLEITGVIDEATYSRMFDVYYAIINSLPEDLYESAARPYPGFALSIGFENQYVRYLQIYLNTVATVFQDIPTVEESGVFDATTEEALRVFQQTVGLEPTGIATFTTWTRLVDTYDDILSGSFVNEDQYPGYVVS